MGVHLIETNRISGARRKGEYMKVFLMAAALLASLNSGVAQADAAGDLSAKAAEAFAKRDYTNSGAASAQEAADLYAKAVEASSNNSDKAKNLSGQSEALYFVGDASAEKSVRIDKFLKGMTAADAATKALGIADITKVTAEQLNQLKSSLSAGDLQIMGDALYFRGANLGQWGQANGVTQSLGKWGELRKNMEIMQTLGLTASHDYGSFRILGRGYFKIPGLLGGDMNKATKYLQQAVANTLVAGKKISRNGTNNNYYAEILNENGDTDAAKALLQEFIAADPSQMDAKSIPELKRTQQEAKELLKKF